MTERSFKTTSKFDVKILCAVWGEEYVQRFGALSLASLLSPRNIPALGKVANIELVFLTRQIDTETIKNLKIFDSLLKFAKVKFIYIDDLVVKGQYSVTLTLAFFRGVRTFGESALGTNFLFWNADFILADGGLATIGKLISQGKRLIMTGTLRALAHIADEALGKYQPNKNGSISFNARDLVALAIDFPQQHHAAKVINQQNSWSSVPSQMFWRINNEAIIGRFFQAFMLCINPTTLPKDINGPCDYSFMPELCPNENPYVIENSDDFFALEVGEPVQEIEYVHIGPDRDESLRRECMNEWLTKAHLETSQKQIVFIARPVSSCTLQSESSNLAEYYNEFMAKVSPPISHKNNYYWTWGVAAWFELRKLQKISFSWPKELAPYLSIADILHSSHHRRYKSLAHLGEHGRGIRGGEFNPNATALKLIDLAAKLFAGQCETEKGILVANAGSLIDRYFNLLGSNASPNIIRLEPNIAEVWALKDNVQINNFLVFLDESNSNDIVKIVSNISAIAGPGAQFKAVLVNLSTPNYENWANERAQMALPLAGLICDLQIEVLSVLSSQAHYEYGMRKSLHVLRHSTRVIEKFKALFALPNLILRKVLSDNGKSIQFATLLRGTFRGSEPI